MFDRVEARAGPEVPFTQEFESACRGLRRYRDPADNYKEMIYLREFGVDAILFRWCRFGASHKLVFLQAGRKTLRQIAIGIATILDWDPYDLQLARLDLAVDVPGISMEWVLGHVRVAYKRSFRQVGGTARKLGKTMYFGRGPDSFRLYDKRVERLIEYKRLARRFGADSLPSFEEFSGISGTVLEVLRVERQMRIGRIPPQIATLRDLEQNITSYDPFSSMVIHRGGKVEPKTEEHSIRRYSEGIELRQTIGERGLAKTWALLNARTGGNASRKMRQLSDFLPPDPEGFCPPNLFEMFQESISRQLSVSAAPNEALEGQTAAAGGTGSEM